ncbi:MAG: flap endonuclease-1 [Candidatus Heimdallarchaeota archaeon]
MGVTKLGDLIPERQEVSFDFFRDKAIAFDGNNILYQFLTRIRQSDGSLLTDEKGNVTSHLSGLLYRVTKSIGSGIKVVFIFDGKPPEEKAKEVFRRKQVKKEAEVAYEEALERGDMELAQKYAQRTARLTTPMLKDATQLLQLMGVPVIHAPMEGEGQAAVMAKKGDVWGSCSQDYDSLLFGTPKLVRNLTISGKRKLPRKNVYVEVKPELIDLERSLKANDLTVEKLIDIAILLGTDFNPNGIGVSGIGPKTALKLIQEHETLENILKLPKMAEAKIDFDIESIRNIFLKPEVISDYTLNWKSPDIDGIVDFLSGQRGFSETRVRNALEKTLKKVAEEKKQPTLDSFFGGS